MTIESCKHLAPHQFHHAIGTFEIPADKIIEFQQKMLNLLKLPKDLNIQSMKIEVKLFKKPKIEMRTITDKDMIKEYKTKVGTLKMKKVRKWRS